MTHRNTATYHCPGTRHSAAYIPRGFQHRIVGIYRFCFERRLVSRAEPRASSRPPLVYKYITCSGRLHVVRTAKRFSTAFAVPTPSDSIPRLSDARAVDALSGDLCVRACIVYGRGPGRVPKRAVDRKTRPVTVPTGPFHSCVLRPFPADPFAFHILVRATKTIAATGDRLHVRTDLPTRHRCGSCPVRNTIFAKREKISHLHAFHKDSCPPDSVRLRCFFAILIGTATITLMLTNA